MTAGITRPRWFSVAALYALQKSMMLMPCGPSAVPTGGAGLARPAWICSVTTARTFLATEAYLSLCGTSVRLWTHSRAACDSLLLLDLQEVQLDGGLASEHRDHDAH